MNFKKPTRVFINQPSRAQEFHHLSGRYAIAMDEKYDDKSLTTTIHFTEGDVHSQRISKLALDVMKISSAEDK